MLERKVAGSLTLGNHGADRAIGEIADRKEQMFKWLRGRNASPWGGVIESVQLDGKRSIKLVRRDNIEHLVLVGVRNDVVIEPNIMRRPVPKPTRQPPPETTVLPPPHVPIQEPLTGRPAKSLDQNLSELTRRLEAGLRGSPPLRRQSPHLRTEAGPSAQSEADGEEARPNDIAEKN